MRRTLTVVISLLLLATLAQTQNSNDEIQLRATVQSIVPLTGFAGQVTPVDVDPRFALTVHVESVIPPVPNFPVGGVVTLAIHSPTLLFAGESTRGKTYNFSVHRTFENGNVGFLGLTVDSDPSQFEGKWQARIGPATGKHSITVNIVVKEGRIGGTVVLVDPVDGSEIESTIVNPELSGRTLKFETNLKEFSWKLTVKKGSREGFLHGSTGHMLIDERVYKQ
jgi:hypothetical protein